MSQTFDDKIFLDRHLTIKKLVTHVKTFLYRTVSCRGQNVTGVNCVPTPVNDTGHSVSVQSYPKRLHRHSVTYCRNETGPENDRGTTNQSDDKHKESLGVVIGE